MNLIPVPLFLVADSSPPGRIKAEKAWPSKSKLDCIGRTASQSGTAFTRWEVFSLNGAQTSTTAAALKQQR